MSRPVIYISHLQNCPAESGLPPSKQRCDIITSVETIEKLRVLSADSQYDLACACGSNKDDRRRRGLDGKWLYPVALPSGGYSILLKTLLSNSCTNDCKYCPLRSDSDLRRCTLAPEEVASIFMDYVRRNKVFGLFLSSAVIGNPDYTMDRINSVARILRGRHQYRGYIHLKIIPGASDAAVEEAISLSSAVSLNIETPGKQHYDLLSGRKEYNKDIIRPIKLMGRLTSKGSKFSRVKCTTQFIVGASEETDSEIIRYMSGLYNKLNFSRVYFSAYQKGLGKPEIPGEKKLSLDPDAGFIREHRLYQADFLIRKYSFHGDEIPLDMEGNLRLDRDPKQVWADSHPEFYPVQVNKADKEALLRVPGLGPDTVKRVLQIRRDGRIKAVEDLRIKGKRAERLRRYLLFE